MTNEHTNCTGCPVSAGTHKPADAVHTEIAEPGAPTAPQAALAAVPLDAAEIGLARREAEALALSLFRKHYAADNEYASGSVAFGLCDSLRGVLSQIDNMTCGLVREANPAHPAEGVPAPVAVGMREAFEAWARDYGTWEVQRDDDRDLGTTGYTDVSLTVAWHAVQASAALAATPAAPDGELEATQDMLTTARTDLELLREALGVPYEPHQSLFDRMLEAAKAAGVPAAAPDARESIGTLWIEENGANDLELCPVAAPKLPPGEYALFAIAAKAKGGG